MTAFRNQRVMVTGAGMGIGYGLCDAFAQAGATVLLNDVSLSAATDAAARINATLDAPRVLPYAFDVAEPAALNAALDDFTRAHGALNIAIANAGITDYGGFLDTTPEQFDRILNVNLRGSYFTAQAAAKHMIAANVRGRILLMSSVVGLRAFLNLTAYGVTKAGIAHMARMLALELGGYGITVNSLCPGAILTERTQRDDPNYAQNWGAVALNERVGQVEDIVHAALFLASPQASHITAQNWVIDGGWSSQSPLPPEHPELPVHLKPSEGENQ